MTQHYVGVKIVEALEQEKEGQQGYAVKYPDGYVSWSPKDVFDRAYLKMGTDPNKVTPEMVDTLRSKIDSDSDINRLLNYIIKWGRDGLKGE